MGISHQRRQGAGTVDGQALIAAQLAAKSDLYRMAKEFAPDANLVAITKQWEIGINENAVNDLSFGGLYFGKWVMNHNSQDRADNDNGKKRSQAFLKHGGDVVARTMILISGNDILAWGTETTSHYGFGTSLHVHKLEDDQQPQHGVIVSFIGYKLSNNPDFQFPQPSVGLNPQGNYNLTAQDLSNIGYTYHWSEADGKGTFINPNSPNAVFVPNGDGTYHLQLVVTDGSNPSAPIVIPPIEVSGLYVYTYENVGSDTLAYNLNGVDGTIEPSKVIFHVMHYPADLGPVFFLKLPVGSGFGMQYYGKNGEDVDGIGGTGTPENTGFTAQVFGYGSGEDRYLRIHHKISYTAPLEGLD